MSEKLLSDLENVLAAELRDAAIPGSVETAVMRHFDRARMRRRVLVGSVVAGMIAASLVIGMVVGRHGDVVHSAAAPKPALAQGVVNPVAVAHANVARGSVKTPRSPTPRAEDTAVFVAIPYTAPLDAEDRATVIRTSMPVRALAAAGLPVIAPEPDAVAEADVLVGEDGQPRAIRVLSISSQ